MNRTPFSLRRQITLAITWYGEDYSFMRDTVDGYNEPTGEREYVQDIPGIYHSSERSFIELVNAEGAAVKSKVSKGILCDSNNDIGVRQNDVVVIHDVEFFVTTVEPVWYGEEVVAYEISLEEVVR